MEYEVRKQPGVTEFRLKGQMGFSDHVQFKNLMAAFESAEKTRVVFNLDELHAVDSSGLGMFIMAREEATRRGHAFTLERPRSEVKRVMDLAKFDRFFDIRA